MKTDKNSVLVLYILLSVRKFFAKALPFFGIFWYNNTKHALTVRPPGQESELKRMRKRILTWLLSAAVTLSAVTVLLSPQRARALTFTPNAAVQSEAAILLNLDVGEVVYEKNADMKEMPAALAQIMTAVVVLENCPDPATRQITATSEMFAPFSEIEDQSDLRYANIRAGDTLTVEDLLYAMMLTSSCEASAMLATEFGGGTEAGFVELMNQKAQTLGLADTRFTNATGLFSARQLTTARDMMKLLQYAMTVPRFEAIACANTYTPPSAAQLEREDDWAWTHSNVMVFSEDEYYCEGVRGVKTGNLEQGGRSIAAKASRDGNNYLLVCLNAPMDDAEGNAHYYHLEDAKAIFEWAFTHLSYQELLTANTEIAEVPVANADGADYVIVKPKEGYSCIWCDTMDINAVQQVKSVAQETDAPVKAGDKLGTVALKLSGETLAEIDLVASESVDRSFWRYNMSEIPGFLRSKYLRDAFLWAIAITIVYMLLALLFAIRFHRQRRKRKDSK